MKRLQAFLLVSVVAAGSFTSTGCAHNDSALERSAAAANSTFGDSHDGDSHVGRGRQYVTVRSVPVAKEPVVLDELFLIGYYHRAGILVAHGTLQRSHGLTIEQATESVRLYLEGDAAYATTDDTHGIPDSWRKRDVWALVYADLVDDEEFSCPAWDSLHQRDANIAALLERNAAK